MAQDTNKTPDRETPWRRLVTAPGARSLTWRRARPRRGRGEGWRKNAKQRSRDCGRAGFGDQGWAWGLPL